MIKNAGRTPIPNPLDSTSRCWFLNSQVSANLAGVLSTKCAIGYPVIVFVSPAAEERLRLEGTVDLLAVQELGAKTGVERFD